MLSKPHQNEVDRSNLTAVGQARFETYNAGVFGQVLTTAGKILTTLNLSCVGTF